MKTIFEDESTPKRDGYRMPAEFEPQDCIWMLWPRRPDNWRDGAKPAQHAYKEVAVSYTHLSRSRFRSAMVRRCSSRWAIWSFNS